MALLRVKRKHVLAATRSAKSSAIYQARIIADGASAYWPLDEPSGTTARDLAGTRTLTLSGAYQLNQPGVTAVSRSVLWNLTGVGVTPTLPTLGLNFTLEAWIFNVHSNIPQFIHYRTLFTDGDFSLKVSILEQLVFFAFFGSAQTITQTSSLTLGQWNYVVVTGATNTLLMYVNGVLVTTSPITLGTQAGAGPAAIGNAADSPTQGTTSPMQDVAQYPRVLSPTEIMAHYNLRLAN